MMQQMAILDWALKYRAFIIQNYLLWASSSQSIDFQSFPEPKYMEEKHNRFNLYQKSLVLIETYLLFPLTQKRTWYEYFAS